jgi:hypothetical protein
VVDGPAQYKIRVQGELRQQWSAWFAGMTIEAEAGGTSVLQGVLLDQAALHGMLARIRDLGLPLVGVERLSAGCSSTAQPSHCGHTLEDG